MGKIDKVIAVGFILAAAGIVGMWIAGFNGNLDVAAVFLLGGGICAYFALCAIGLKSLRRWQRGY